MQMKDGKSEMTKKIIKGLSIIAFIMASLIAMTSMNSSIEALDKEQEKNYAYHFQVIIDKELDAHARNQLVEGFYSASKEKNVYIELIESIDNEHKKEIIDKAIYSKVDGIAYSVEVKADADSLGKKAAAVDIPMVNYSLTGQDYEHIENIQDTPYNIAKLMGVHVKDIVKKNKIAKDKKILLFLKECNTKDEVTNDKIIKGFYKGISSKYKDNIKVVRVDAEKYDVNSKLKSQINKNKKAKYVVCFDEEYTEVASSIYADKNYKSKVKVIGYGATKNNTEAIKEKKLTLLYCVKEKSIGYNAINVLVAKKKNVQIDKEKYLPLVQLIKLDKNNNLEYIDKYTVASD